MKISVITGHLTPTNKAHIKALFLAELMKARVNRISYKIERLSEPNEYKVTTSQVDHNIIIGEPISISKATFKTS